VKAYPIKPVYLLDHLEVCDAIIYGDVAYYSYENINRENPWYGDGYQAHVKTNEVLRGADNMEFYPIFYSPNMICPNPAQYKEGEKVLAFLKSMEGSFVTNGLSYGTKYFDSNHEYQIYKKRIQSFYNIPIDNRYSHSKLQWILENLTIDFLKKDAIRYLKREIDGLTKVRNRHSCDPKENLLDYATMKDWDKIKSAFVSDRFTLGSINLYMLTINLNQDKPHLQTMIQLSMDNCWFFHFDFLIKHMKSIAICKDEQMYDEYLSVNGYKDSIRKYRLLARILDEALGIVVDKNVI